MNWIYVPSKNAGRVYEVVTFTETINQSHIICELNIARASDNNVTLNKQAISVSKISKYFSLGLRLASWGTRLLKRRPSGRNEVKRFMS